MQESDVLNSKINHYWGNAGSSASICLITTSSTLISPSNLMPFYSHIDIILELFDLIN